MELSFILTTNNNDNPEFLAKFLERVFSSKKTNFEVIIVDNYLFDTSSLKIITDYFHLFPKQLQIITNYKPLDNATSRNLGVEIARGKYLSFLHATELIEEKYFETVFHAFKQYKNVDCLEYNVSYNWGDSYFFETITRIETNQIYDIKSDEAKLVYAQVSPLIATKVFRKEVILENVIKFRKPLQFSALFVYSFLAHAKTLVTINEKLISNNVNIINHDNNFDLINQWIHILNYYNNLNLKKKYSDELEYAAVRYFLYNFLWAIASSKNPVLTQKVYDHIKAQIFKRFKNFRKNPYLNNKRSHNDQFPILCADFAQYMKKFFLENKLRDDSKFWRNF